MRTSSHHYMLGFPLVANNRIEQNPLQEGERLPLEARCAGMGMERTPAKQDLTAVEAAERSRDPMGVRATTA